MNNIKIIDGHYVRMQKVMFHESEIILARCFSFNINIDDQVIIADLKMTSKRSLYEFIKLSFKSFSESPMEENSRNDFYSEVQDIYNRIYAEVEPIIKAALPYWDSLYTHQREGLVENYYKKHVFLAYEQGMGKSISAASISRIHKIPRTVIFCPQSVKHNWFRDMLKFKFNELYFTILDAAKRRTIKAFNERFVIVNYDVTEKFFTELSSAPIGHFIFDEATYLKNKGSLRFKSIQKLVAMFPEAHITMLSGTPVKNRVDDVFSYLKLIGHELGANYKKFMDEYTVKTVGRFSKVTGGKNLQDLYVKLSNFMVRKTKKECLDLPEKIYLSYTYQLDDYRADYDKVVEELNNQKEHAALSGSLHSLNIITARAKIKGIIEIAEGIIEEGRKVVIFSGYKVPIKLLEEHFGTRCVTVDGSIDAFTRDKNIQQFWNDESCQVFIGNITAAGMGINLTCASDIIFTNYPFTPAELWQCIDRCHRIGQGNSVNVHYTECEDSIDTYIKEILDDKEKDIHTLVDQGRDMVSSGGNITELLISKLLKKDVETGSPVSDNSAVGNGIEQPKATDKPDMKIKSIEAKIAEPSVSLELPDWMQD